MKKQTATRIQVKINVAPYKCFERPQNSKRMYMVQFAGQLNRLISADDSALNTEGH